VLDDNQISRLIEFGFSEPKISDNPNFSKVRDIGDPSELISCIDEFYDILLNIYGLQNGDILNFKVMFQ
jgi:hypothetical protein